MKKLLYALSISFLSNTLVAQTDSATIKKIFNEALLNGTSYSNLDYLVNSIGGRLSGSQQAEDAVEWAFNAMKIAGADTVYLQPCMVPHWVRGEKEIGKVITSDGKGIKDVAICALGGSIGTPKEGITAQVIEANGIDDLKKMSKEKVQGKIVFLNQAMDLTAIETGSAYGKASSQRKNGAAEAAKLGAIAVVIRSATMRQDDNPHTGAMNYQENVPQIPACAISTNGANWLSSYLKTDTQLKFYLKMSCENLPDVVSYNVIGEIKGSELPKEYITAGGHLDSWDTGKGAHDDGAGVVQSIEIIRIYKALGLKPKRTIRIVAFMNEENGVRGGLKYAEEAKLRKEKHLAAMESDNGGFAPRGFASSGSPEARAKIKSWKPLFEPYGIYNFDKTGGGTDIEPLKELGVTCIGLSPNSQLYFDYHHTEIDTLEAVNKRELGLGGAAMASLIWLISQYGL